jgi:hypothetical protein
MQRVYLVQPGDTPMSITRRFVGNTQRAFELIQANQHKPSVFYERIRTFASLTPGEALWLPRSWTTGLLGAPSHQSTYGGHTIPFYDPPHQAATPAPTSQSPAHQSSPYAARHVPRARSGVGDIPNYYAASGSMQFLDESPVMDGTCAPPMCAEPYQGPYDFPCPPCAGAGADAGAGLGQVSVSQLPRLCRPGQIYDPRTKQCHYPAYSVGPQLPAPLPSPPVSPPPPSPPVPQAQSPFEWLMHKRVTVPAGLGQTATPATGSSLTVPILVGVASIAAGFGLAYAVHHYTARR